MTGISVVYGAYSAIVQTDLKYINAYSSVSHCGLVLFAILMLNQTAVTGAIMQMLSHGLMTALFFALIGTIYGQGDQVFLDKNEDNGFHECPKTCEAFRPRMMLFEDVENFTVRDVTLKDAAFWTLHMAGCRNVRIDGIKILNDDRGANNDGIDPDCCRNVVIANCIVSTGDDAIVVKSTC